MQLLLYALNFFLVVIEIISLNHLASGFFVKKKTARTRFLITSAYVILVNIFMLVCQNNTFLRLIASIVLALGWMLLTYRTNLLKSIFIAAFWIALLTIIDSLFLVSSTLLKINTDQSLMSDPFAYYLLCYSAKIFELLIAVVLRTWAKNHFHHLHSHWTDWLRVLFFPLASVASTIVLVRVLYIEPQLSKELFLCIFIMLLADLMAVFLLNYLDTRQQAALENTILRQNLKLEYEHIEALKESYAEQRTQTHDFQNQLNVLHELAKHKASQEEFAQYLDQILSVTFPTPLQANTGRLVVDIILSQKHAAAKSKGIILRTSLSDLTDFPLPDDALVVVLTNLIDNAMEACEKLPEGRRHILLKMQTSPDSSILYIENPTLHPVRIKNNHVLTTKNNSLAHGYGLKNVYTTLERHNAVYVIDYNPATSTFCFSSQITD